MVEVRASVRSIEHVLDQVRAQPATGHGDVLSGRIAIEAVTPEIDGGRFPAKRVTGERVEVSADIFADGHDVIAAEIIHRGASADGTLGDGWSSAPMRLVQNDRWSGHFTVYEAGFHEFTVAAWRDPFASWRTDTVKKRAAGRAIALELEEGQTLIERARETTGDTAFAERLREIAEAAESQRAETELADILLGEDLAQLMTAGGPREDVTRYEHLLRIWVDRPTAAFSAWYELFPRSQSGDVRRHGTFADVEARLGYVRDLGFDVLYFTPIHPIGKINRKGRNNSLTAEAGDPGSPYAIGSDEGGHDAIHPELGTVSDFRRLVRAAKEHGLEIALDFAIQCAPDHPWVREHPEWFEWRPDGTIKFAENPPKKYEDIVNVSFYGDAYPELWHALRDVVLYWAEQGVRIFRVDNPHTKPYPFWEWMIAAVRTQFPDAIFLAEAFTRPKVMKRLAKLGFSQSYTYFTWRNTKQELTEYLTELTRTQMAEYYRPNFFANTPDINPIPLQTSGRAGFRSRLVLAATLAGNYGIYNGFELCEATPLPGKEEYLDSEKYEIRAWDWDREGHIKDDVRLVNALRRGQPALQQFRNLAFYNAWNDQVLYYGKYSDDRSNFILIAVSLDPHTPQGAHFEVPLWEFDLPDDASISVEDLVTGDRWSWSGKVQHIWIDPADRPYRIWRLLPPGEVR